MFCGRSHVTGKIKIGKLLVPVRRTLCPGPRSHSDMHPQEEGGGGDSNMKWLDINAIGTQNQWGHQVVLSPRNPSIKAETH